MRQSALSFIALLTSHILSMALCGCSRIEPVPFAEAPEEVDSKSLVGTVIVSNLEEAISPGKNLVYCGTFQLAWNELRDEVIGEDIHLVGEPPLVAKLNRKLVTKDMVPRGSYIAMVGFGKDEIVRQINEALVEEFGDAAPVVEEEMKPGDILAYAYLLRVLRFATPFEKLEAPLDFPDADVATPVVAFGIEEYNEKNARHRRMAEQVEVFTYDYDTEEFVVRLTVDSEADELILAKIAPKETLQATVEAVRQRMTQNIPKRLSHEDTLQIPRLSFNIMHSYDELLGRGLLNKGFETYFISKAFQSVQFSLCEIGVQVASESLIEAMSIPRKLVFDSPFLIMLLKKESDSPYLVIWVANAELMELVPTREAALVQAYLEWKPPSGVADGPMNPFHPRLLKLGDELPSTLALDGVVN